MTIDGRGWLRRRLIQTNKVWPLRHLGQLGFRALVSCLRGGALRFRCVESVLVKESLLTGDVALGISDVDALVIVRRPDFNDLRRLWRSVDRWRRVFFFIHCDVEIVDAEDLDVWRRRHLPAFMFGTELVFERGRPLTALRPASAREKIDFALLYFRGQFFRNFRAASSDFTARLFCQRAAYKILKLISPADVDFPKAAMVARFDALGSPERLCLLLLHRLDRATREIDGPAYDAAIEKEVRPANSEWRRTSEPRLTAAVEKLAAACPAVESAFFFFRGHETVTIVLKDALRDDEALKALGLIREVFAGAEAPVTVLTRGLFRYGVLREDPLLYFENCRGSVAALGRGFPTLDEPGGDDVTRVLVSQAAEIFSSCHRHAVIEDRPLDCAWLFGRLVRLRLYADERQVNPGFDDELMKDGRRLFPELARALHEISPGPRAVQAERRYRWLRALCDETRKLISTVA